MKNKQKQDFESAVGKLNATYFFREFTFSTNTFKPNPAKELELADKVVWLDDLMILSQIKERIAPPHTTADKERKWFTDEVVKKATRQMRDTLSYLKTYPKIKVRNNRRHVFNIASAQVTQTHRIVIYNPHPLLPSECATKKYHRSKTAGVLMAEMSQRGWLTKEDRKKHGKVWIFHWYKARPGDGKRVENTAVVGRVASFSKESSAWEEVDRRGLNHNIDGANSLMGRITFGELAHSYEKHAVPKLAGTTQRTVRHIIDDYLIPRWGKQSAGSGYRDLARVTPAGESDQR